MINYKEAKKILIKSKIKIKDEIINSSKSLKILFIKSNVWGLCGCLATWTVCHIESLEYIFFVKASL